MTAVTSGGEGDRRPRPRPGLTRRAGTRGVGSCNGRARARERAPGGGGPVATRGGTGVARPDRRRGRRRTPSNRAKPPRRRTATTGHLSVSLGLEASRADAATSDTLGRAQEEVDGAIAELRELARGIHPTLLRDEGLAAGRPGARASNAGPRHGARQRWANVCPIRSSSRPTSSSPRRSRTSSSTRRRRKRRCCSSGNGGVLRVTVADDGVGGAHIAADSGLAGLRDRLEALDAPLVIESGRARNDRPRGVPMRVVIADDAPLIREGIARLLSENDVEVVDQVDDADALLARVRDLRPDVALVDVRMPPTHTDEGLRAAREIRAALSRDRRARPLATPRTRIRAAAHRREARPRRLPAEGARRTRRATARRDAPRRGGRMRRRSGSRRTSCSTRRRRSIRSRSSRHASARSSP